MCWWAHAADRRGLNLHKWREVFAMGVLWFLSVPQIFPVKKDDCLTTSEYTQTLSLLE